MTRLLILPLLALVAFAPTPASPATPCTQATAACTEWVTLGAGPSRSLVYRTYPLDTRNEAITRVLVMVHGAGRDADNYFRRPRRRRSWRARSTTRSSSPRASPPTTVGGCRDELGPNEVSWNCSTWRSGGPALNDPSVTSFDFLDAILREVARKEVFPNLRAIVVAGHSAGGQVVNRYEMTNQVHDDLGVPVTYVVANPSSYAWPSAERPTDAAWSLTANPPGYIPEVRPNAPAFRSLGDGRGCTTYDQWPYGLENHTGYSEKQSDDQIRRQLAITTHQRPLGQAGHPPPRRIRLLVLGDGAGPHPAGPGAGLRQVRERKARRPPPGRHRPGVRAQRALHVHRRGCASADLPGGVRSPLARTLRARRQSPAGPRRIGRRAPSVGDGGAHPLRRRDEVRDVLLQLLRRVWLR